MEPEAQKILDTILAKPATELTPHDKAFLKARWAYVGRNSRKKFQQAVDKPDEEVEMPKVEPADGTLQHPAEQDTDQDDDTDE